LKSFVENRISERRYKNTTEVIRSGLILLEEENRTIALKVAINDGLESGIVKDFDPKKHLASLKANKHKNG
jgi:antitoxin ParD1/3/4